MDEISVSNAKELEDVLKDLPSDSLFRGQTKHYTEEDGSVSMPTSFCRHGCVPSKLLKWAHYASFVLRTLSDSDSVDFDLHLPQAVLQHYGWRSFFIDASSSTAISAWFASHSFQDENTLRACEDCHGEFVLSCHQEATYAPMPAASISYLYAVSRDRLLDCGIECFDLAAIEARDCRPRFHAQQAWLIGPLKDKLPPECLIACISAPAGVLAEYAKSSGYSETPHLFPSRTEDPVLELLLSVPWIPLDGESETPAFIRGLGIPEYDYTPTKSHPPHSAFYRPFWVADNRGPDDTPFAKTAFFRTPEEAFYGRPIEDPLSLPNVEAVIREHRSVILEAESILRHPEFHEQTQYLKGVCIRLVDDDIVEVCELTLEHPGSLVTGAGLEKGWYYKIDESHQWSRVRHADE